MNLKKTVFILSFLIFAEPGWGQTNKLQKAFARRLSAAQNTMVDMQLYGGAVPSRCSQQVLDARADGRLDITLVYGYTDVPDTREFRKFLRETEGAPLFRPGDVLDRDAVAAMKKALKRSCKRGLKACGFRGRGSVLQKTIRDRWSRSNRLNVRINIMAPATTAQDVTNNTDAQEARSAQVEALFHQGLANDDAVIYIGHARNGAGPDFYPKSWSKGGRNAMLSTLRGAGEPTSYLGLLACRGTSKFRGAVRGQSSGTAVVTAGNLFDFWDTFPAGLAMVEAIVGQLCADEMTRALQGASKNNPGDLSIIF